MNKIFIAYNVNKFNKEKVINIAEKMNLFIDTRDLRIKKEIYKSVKYERFGKIQMIYSKVKQNKFKIVVNGFVLLNICGFIENKDEICKKYKCSNIEDLLISSYKSSNESLKKLIKELNGQYVLFFYNKKSDKIIIINDRLGLYSAYYFEENDKLLYSTIPESIIKAKENNIINFDAIADYLKLGIVLNGETFVRDVGNLEPSTIYVKEKENTGFFEKYFKIQCDDNEYEKEIYLNNTNVLFKESVKSLFSVFKGETVASLTGGFDTRLINSVLVNEEYDYKVFYSTQSKKWIKSRIEFTSLEEDRKISKKLADKFNLKYNVLEKKEDFSHFFKNVSTVMTGLFGGEIFGANSLECFSTADTSKLKKISFNLSSSFEKQLSRDSVKFYIDAMEKVDSKDIKKREFVHINNLFLTSFFVHLGSYSSPDWESPNNFFYNNKWVFPFLNNNFIENIYKIPLSELMEHGFYKDFFAKFYKKFCKIDFLHGLNNIYKYRNNKEPNIYYYKELGAMNEFCIKEKIHKNNNQYKIFFNKLVDFNYYIKEPRKLKKRNNRFYFIENKKKNKQYTFRLSKICNWFENHFL